LHFKSNLSNAFWVSAEQVPPAQKGKDGGDCQPTFFSSASGDKDLFEGKKEMQKQLAM
jgi:hypothetical protein